MPQNRGLDLKLRDLVLVTKFCGDDLLRSLTTSDLGLYRSGQLYYARPNLKSKRNPVAPAMSETTKMPWRDMRGNIIGTFGMSHDNTEKKRAAELAAMRVWGKYAPVDLVRRLYREKSEPVLVAS